MLYNNKLTRAVVLSYLTLPPGTNAPQTCRVAGRIGMKEELILLSHVQIMLISIMMLGLLWVCMLAWKMKWKNGRASDATQKRNGQNIPTNVESLLYQKMYEQYSFGPQQVGYKAVALLVHAEYVCAARFWFDTIIAKGNGPSALGITRTHGARNDCMTNLSYISWSWGQCLNRVRSCSTACTSRICMCRSGLIRYYH